MNMHPVLQEAVAARIGDDRERGALAAVLRLTQHRLVTVQDARQTHEGAHVIVGWKRNSPKRGKISERRPRGPSCGQIDGVVFVPAVFVRACVITAGNGENFVPLRPKN